MILLYLSPLWLVQSICLQPALDCDSTRLYFNPARRCLARNGLFDIVSAHSLQVVILPISFYTGGTKVQPAAHLVLNHPSNESKTTINCIMRISIPVHVLAAVLTCSAVVSVDGFSPSISIGQTQVSPKALLLPGTSNHVPTTTALFAKKKAKKTPAAAALEQLEKLESLEANLPDPIGNGAPVGVAAAVEEPLSKKEQMALEKQRKKEAKAAKKAAEQAQKAEAAESQKAQRAAALAALENGEEMPDPFAVEASGLSKKEQMALEKKAQKEAKKAAAAEAQQQPQAAGGAKDPRAAALKALEEMERAEAAQLEAQAASDEYDEFAPPPKEEDVLAGMDLSGMSKKEIKKLRQKEEKKRDKMAAKAAKKAARKAEMDDDLAVGGVPGEGLESSDVNGNAAVEDIDVSISEKLA